VWAQSVYRVRSEGGEHSYHSHSLLSPGSSLSITRIHLAGTSPRPVCPPL